MRWFALLFAAAGSLAAAGCVNDYLHGELAAGTSTGELDPESMTSSSGSSSSSATTGDSASGEGTTTDADGSSSSSGGEGDTQPTTSMGDGDGSSSSGGDMQLELCQGPCDSNAMCAGESNLCVELTELNPVCLRACGRGCPKGYSCMERQSVEGGSAEQCVPDGNVCP